MPGTDRNISYREATRQDIPSLANIRSIHRGTAEFWQDRISEYLNGTHHPQHALEPRIIYVASAEPRIIDVASAEPRIMGFVAGHLSRRYACDGELQWIDVVGEFRRQGIATGLVKELAKWFVANGATKICVDPGDEIARHFYRKNGAEDLNQYWMVWRDIRVVL